MAIDSASTREELALRYAALITHASLHTADPAGTGADEVVGGAYVRLPITWNTGGADGQIVSDLLTFEVPAGTTVTHVGGWDSLTGGTYRDKWPFEYEVTYPEDGQLTITIQYVQS